MKCHPKHASSGFTLVELAVSLIIIALLIGGLTMPLSAQMELRDINETRKQLDEAREALLGYAVINGHLPCPATKISSGVSVPCATSAPQDGILPWADLGLRRTDSWGHYIRYRVLNNFATPSTITLSTNVAPALTIKSDSAAATSLTTGGTVVAILISHGKNGYGGTLDNGNTISVVSPSNSNADEQQNDAAISSVSPATIYQRTPSNDQSGTNTEFDDIVTWIPVSILINRLVIAGKVTTN